MLGFMIITNDPLEVAKRVKSPKLMVCAKHSSCVFVPCEERTLDLAAMQNAVKGYLELFYSVPNINNLPCKSIDFFCNEEGSLNMLAPLRAIVGTHRVHGDVLVCATDSNGDSVALSEYDLFQSLVHTTIPSSLIGLETIKEWTDAGNPLTLRLQKEVTQYAILQTKRLNEVYSSL